MKLSKLYSNDKRFKTIIFNDNFNVILGEIKNGENLNKDSHNLGKSTLIYLIDFMLLKEIDKNHFLKSKEFSEHTFFLEIELNSGNYLTIKRNVKRNTRISFKVHKDKNQDFVSITEWDYEELPLTSTDPNKSPKVILEKYLGFDVLINETYRKTVGYFFRTQEDYNDVFKLHKHKGTDLLWKPVLYELLGFTSEFMVKKYNLEDEITRKEELIDKLKEEFEIDAGEIDKIHGLIEIKEEERKSIVSWLDKFDFYKKESNISKEVVNEVEKQIAKYNLERYNLDFEIQQIEESLKENIDYNLDDILDIFNEVQIYFTDYLKKSYEELIDFNKKVFIERKKYLEQVLIEKEKSRINVDKQLQILNQKRSSILGDLKETNTFDKYNKYRDDLIKIERELERHNVELESIDSVNKIQKEVDALKKDLGSSTDLLKEQIGESSELYKNIRKDFHDYVKYILNQNAMISIIINSNNNVDFEAKFLNSDNEETAQSLGHSYRKILCACFDLAVIKNYISKSFYRVIYHDGCLESLDPRKRKKYLALIRKISKEYNIQYILTGLKSDFPIESDYKLKEEEIAVVLDDEDDDSGRLFGFGF